MCLLDVAENGGVSKLELAPDSFSQRMPSTLNPKRTVAELKELRAFTADDNGAQRVAFTPLWVETRAWLKQKLAGLPVETHTDEA